MSLPRIELKITIGDVLTICTILLTVALAYGDVTKDIGMLQAKAAAEHTTNQRQDDQFKTIHQDFQHIDDKLDKLIARGAK